MNDALDLEPIKTRLAATTPGKWQWWDEIRDVPYDTEFWTSKEKRITTGNDGRLGVKALYIEHVVDEDRLEYDPILWIDDEEDVPKDPDDPDEVDWYRWRGHIHVSNVADLEFIVQAKNDIAALIAEVERLRALLSQEQPPQPLQARRSR